MKLTIENNEVRVTSRNGQSLRVHMREDGDTDIVSFEVCKGGLCGGGGLPDVEFGKRDTLLRHLGNRIEKIR